MSTNHHPEPDYFDDDGWPVWETRVRRLRATSERWEFSGAASTWVPAATLTNDALLKLGPPLPDGPRQMPREGRRVRDGDGRCGTLASAMGGWNILWDDGGTGIHENGYSWGWVAEWDPPLPVPTVVDEDGMEWRWAPRTEEQDREYELPAQWHSKNHDAANEGGSTYAALTALYRATHDGRAPWEET